MTPWQNRITELTRRMADDMKVRNYSQRTIDAYTYHVGKFADFLGKRPKKLPAVLSGEEVNRLLSCVNCHKHRTFLLVQYACGLRLNEAAHLKISDIDSQRMQLRVDSGKGQKTRMVPMLGAVAVQNVPEEAVSGDGEQAENASVPCCPKCQCRMTPGDCVGKPSWRIVLRGPHRPRWYRCRDG